MFGEKICKVLEARAPIYQELALTDAVTDPVEAHVHGFGAASFDSIVDDAIGGGVPVWPGVGPWGCSISMRAVCMGMLCLQLMKRPPILDSAADDMTFLMMLLSVWTAPLNGMSRAGGLEGSADLGPMKKNPPAWLRADDAVR